MTDEELVKLWYDDIKQSTDSSWFENLFKFPKHEACFFQFFDVLPEPLKGYARKECEISLTHMVKLGDLFDHGFTWSEAEHGKAWSRLYRAIDGKLHGKKIEIPTVYYLLSSMGERF